MHLYLDWKTSYNRLKKEFLVYGNLKLMCNSLTLQALVPKKTALGKVDCCLANIDAINLHNLTVISQPLHIEMTWVAFSKNTTTQKEFDNGKQQVRISY